VRFKQRVDRLSKSINEIQFAQGGIRVCFQEHGQTKEEAMAAAGIEPEDNSLTIFVMHWATKPLPSDILFGRNTVTPEPKKSLAEIDSELQQLRSELNKETQ